MRQLELTTAARAKLTALPLLLLVLACSPSPPPPQEGALPLPSLPGLAQELERLESLALETIMTFKGAGRTRLPEEGEGELKRGLGLLEGGEGLLEGLRGISAVLDRMVDDEGAKERMRDAAREMDVCLENALKWAEQAAASARAGLESSTPEEMAGRARDSMDLASRTLFGVDRNGDGLLQPVRGEGGLQEAGRLLHRMGDAPADG